MSAEQQNLIDAQLQQQEKLEAEQTSEVRKVNNEADEEMRAEKQEIDENIDQQKKLVRSESPSMGMPFIWIYSSISYQFCVYLLHSKITSH